MNLQSINISRKLPVFMVAFCIFISTVLIIFSIFSSKQYAIENVKANMATLVAGRQLQVVQMLAEAQDDLVVTAASASTISALRDFDTAWSGLGSGAAKQLQTEYITRNPNDTGLKHLLDRAPGDSPYHAFHAQYHPGFRKLIEAKGYYDAFLIDNTGDIIYSVFKELDYATNLVNGDYRDSGLAEVFEAARSGQADQIYFNDMQPYAPSAGAAAAFLAMKVVDQTGKALGVLAIQLPVDLISQTVNHADGLGETTQIYIIGADHKSRSNSRFDGDYSVLDFLPKRPHIDEALDGSHHFHDSALGMHGHEVMSYSRPVDFTLANWAIIAEQDVVEILQPLRSKTQMLVIASLVIIVMLSWVGWLFGRSITDPLQLICEDMSCISSGDLGREVSAAGRGDEIGQIGKTLVSMQTDLKKAKSMEKERMEASRAQASIVSTLSAGLNRLSQGDFSQEITEAFGAEHDKLREDYNKTVQHLSAAITKVVDAASSIETGTTEVNQATEDLSQRTENQATTLAETATALEEVTENVKSAAESAQRVENIVSETKSVAEASDEVVQNAVLAMTEIEQSSEQIGQILSVINEISFQTNLLALNAGVEAARAGDAGRGFAVVASEVRALAQRSSEAASEIKDLISKSNKQVKDGAALVGKAGDALTSTVERVNHISNLISEIAAGSTKQSTGLSEINDSVLQLDQVTQQNAAMVQETTAASMVLSKDVTDLRNTVSEFKTTREISRPKQTNIVRHAPQRAKPQTENPFENFGAA